MGGDEVSGRGVPDSPETPGGSAIGRIDDVLARARRGEDVRPLLAALSESDRQAVTELLRTDVRGDGAVSVPPLPDSVWQHWIGRQLGEFTLTRFVGRGGMGAVFEALQDRPRRKVAVKIMARDLSVPAARKRFEAESSILAGLDHPHIARVFAAGATEIGGILQPWFAMEFVPDARPVTAWAGERNLPIAERIDLFLAFCDAVTHGHQRAVIHRDLKPSNLVVDTNGSPRVIDFGVARLISGEASGDVTRTERGILVGTLEYMSPEQADLDAAGVDVRSDIYALGLVLYELLTDRRPYNVPTSPVTAAIRAIRESPPIRPSSLKPELRGDLDAILLRALEKEPAHRYQHASDLADDLRRHRRGEPVLARPPSFWRPVLLAARRHRVTAGILGLAFLGVLSAGLVAFVQWRSAATNVAKKESALRVQRIQAAAAAIERHDIATARALLANERNDASFEVEHLRSRLSNSLDGTEVFGEALLEAIVDSRRGSTLAISWRRRVFLIRDGLPREELSFPSVEHSFVAFAPEPDCLVSGSRNALTGLGLVDIDTTRRHRIRTIGIPGEETDALTGLAFHPGGRCFVLGVNEDEGLSAAGSEGPSRLQLWSWPPSSSPAEPSLMERLDAREITPKRLVFSPSGDILAVAGHSRGPARKYFIQIFRCTEVSERPSLAHLAELRAHGLHVMDVAFSPDGQWLASVGADGLVALWRVADIEQERSNASYHAVALDPAAADHAVVFAKRHGLLWLAWGGIDAAIHTIAVPPALESRPWLGHTWRSHAIQHGHTAEIRSLGCLPDGRLVSASQDGSLRFWDPAGAESMELRGHLTHTIGVLTLAEGRRCVSLDRNGGIRLWSSETGELLAESSADRFFTGPHGQIDGAAIAGKTLVVARTQPHDGPKTVSRIRIAGKTLVVPRRQVRAVAGGSADTIELAFLEAIEESHIHELRTVPWGPEDSGIAIPPRNSAAPNRDPCIAAAEASGGAIRIVIGTPGGELHVLTARRAADSFTVTRDPVYPAFDGGAVTAVRFLDAEGRRFLCARAGDAGNGTATTTGNPGRLEIHDTNRKGPATFVECPATTLCLAVRLSDGRVASGHADGSIRLFSVDSSDPSPRLRPEHALTGNGIEVTSLAFHASEPRLFAGRRNGIVEILDTADATSIVALRTQMDHITGLAYDAAAGILISSGAGPDGRGNVLRLMDGRSDRERRLRRAEERANAIRRGFDRFAPPEPDPGTGPESRAADSRPR